MQFNHIDVFPVFCHLKNLRNSLLQPCKDFFFVELIKNFDKTKIINYEREKNNLPLCD
jgi:hypothetical protein